MSASLIAFWIAAAVLLFWTVGAYNRLVQLRQGLAQRFALVEAQFRQRQALLQRLLDAVAPHAVQAGQAIEVLRAACLQAEAACAHALARPAAVGATTSLRLAEEILTEARTRLPEPVLAEAGVAELLAELAAADSTLAFARRQFNEAVDGYNAAVRQFPTWVVAGPFGFRPAGTF